MENIFILKVPDYSLATKRVALAFGIAGLGGSLFFSYSVESLSPILFGVVAIAVAAIFQKRSGQALPSMIEVQNSTLILHDFPKFDSDYTRNFNEIIPLFELDLSNSNFEWIGDWLYVNRLNSGDSIKICQHASQGDLSEWLISHGFTVINPAHA